MRLKKEVYNERMLYIIGAALRYVRDGQPVENMPVAIFVHQYGFTKNFSKTEKLTVALKAMVAWVDRVRQINKKRFGREVSPTSQAMLTFVKSRL